MEKWEFQKLWVTPKSQQHLHQLLDSYDGTERAAVYNAAMFMWNFCAQMHNNEIDTAHKIFDKARAFSEKSEEQRDESR